MSGSCPTTASSDGRTDPNRGTRCAALLLLGLLALSGSCAAAAETGSVQVDGVSFASRHTQPGGDLALVGTGILPWKFLFRAYAAAFYLPDGVPSADWSQDVAKRLVIHYFWDIPGEKFGPAGEEVLRRMYAPSQLAGIRPQLEAIDRAYVSVEEGDRYALVYTPGRGTILLHNDAPLITLPGAEFARLYFSIWLGPEPVDPDLRDALLGAE